MTDAEKACCWLSANQKTWNKGSPLLCRESLRRWHAPCPQTPPAGRADDNRRLRRAAITWRTNPATSDALV